MSSLIGFAGEQRGRAIVSQPLPHVGGCAHWAASYPACSGVEPRDHVWGWFVPLVTVGRGHRPILRPRCSACGLRCVDMSSDRRRLGPNHRWLALNGLAESGCGRVPAPAELLGQLAHVEAVAAAAQAPLSDRRRHVKVNGRERRLRMRVD